MPWNINNADKDPALVSWVDKSPVRGVPAAEYIISLPSLALPKVVLGMPGGVTG